MKKRSSIHAAFALLPGALLLCSALAGACSSSGAPTLGSVEGNLPADGGSADATSSGGFDANTPVTGDAASQGHDASSGSEAGGGETDSSMTMSTPDDASIKGAEDAPVIFADAAEFPEAGSFDAAPPPCNLNCPGSNAAPTCCTSAGTCVASSDTTCGYAGFPCVDCTATSQTCGPDGEYLQGCR